jgi:hypothetical protein
VQLDPHAGPGLQCVERLSKHSQTRAPGGLVNKGVMCGKRMTMRDIPRPLGEDAQKREEVCREGDILWMDGVDQH